MIVNRHVHAYEENSCLVKNFRNISLKDDIPDHVSPIQVIWLTEDREWCIILSVFFHFFVLLVILGLAIVIAVDIFCFFRFVELYRFKDVVLLIVQRNPVLAKEFEPN